MGSIQEPTTVPVKDDVRAIVPTPEELKCSSFDSRNLWKAMEALHQDGLVLLKGVVDVNHIKNINEFMCKEADELVRTKAKPYNQGVNSNILQGPPVGQPDLHYDDVYFNPFVIQLMNAYLGHNPIWNFTTGNNALPKTSGMRQPVHKDIMFHHPQCPFFVIANFPLCEFNPSTGSTEFWLGSHAHTAGHEQEVATEGYTLANAKARAGEPICNVRPEVVEERRKIRPPIQPSCGPGDVLLRDLRTWHAGMPNESDHYRIMLAIGYQAQWYPNHKQRTCLPESYANFFMKHGGQPVEVRTNFIADDSPFGKINDVFNFRYTDQ